MHVRAALRNGLTRSEIAEVIHHTALYAGLAGGERVRFAILREVFAELDAEPAAGARASLRSPSPTSHHSNQENDG